MEIRTFGIPVERGNRNRLNRALRGLLATATLSLALQGPQIHAQTSVEAGSPQACQEVMFHYPHSSVVPVEGYISDDQIAEEEVQVTKSASDFAEGLDPDLNFTSLHTTAIGFAEICNDQDRIVLEEHGATDIEDVKTYDLFETETIVQDSSDYPDKDVRRIMKPDETWSRGATGAKAGLNVVLIDTGVQTNHPAIADSISSVQKCFSEVKNGYESSCPNGKVEDDSAYINDIKAGHGTMMAGLITTVSHGKVIPIQVTTAKLDEHGERSEYILSGNNIARAYDWVIASKDRIAAVNASYGAGRYTSSEQCTIENKLEAELIGKIVQRGIAFVAASGNDPGLNFTDGPACISLSEDRFDGVVAVGSSTKDDAIAFHTSMAEWVKVLAPGEGVVTTFPGDAFVGSTGTSDSTALVTGAIQVQRDIYQNGSPAFMEKNLVDTGVKIIDQRADAEGKLTGLSGARVDFLGMSDKWQADYIRQHPADRVFLPLIQSEW